MQGLGKGAEGWEYDKEGESPESAHVKADRALLEYIGDEDITKAFRAYKELNRVFMEKMPPRSYLLTCSCSYHVSEELFQNILFRAALEANRKVRILERHRQAPDHPISIFHPESSYLKSFLLYLD